jgi:hypothetical protein
MAQILLKWASVLEVFAEQGSKLVLVTLSFPRLLSALMLLTVLATISLRAVAAALLAM